MKSILQKGAITLSFSSLIFIGSSFILNFWLARHLGPTDFGVYGLITSIVGLISVIQTSGISQAVAKFSAENIKEADNVLTSGLIMILFSTIIFFITLFFFADLISKLLGDISLTPYIRLSAFIVLVYGVYGLYSDYFNGVHKFSKQALMNSLYSVGKLLGVIIFAFLFNLSGALYGYIIASIVPLIFCLYIPKRITKLFSIKKLSQFAIQIIGITIFSNLLLSLDLFLLKTILKVNTNLGYYTAAQNISRLILHGLSAFYIMIMPVISHSTSNNLHEDTKKVIWRILRFAVIILTPTAALISGTSEELIDLIYTKQYDPAAAPLSILIFGISFYTLYVILSNILTGSGKPKIPFIISLIALSTSLVMGYILIPTYHLIGSAAATTIGSFVALITASVLVFRQFHTLISIHTFSKIIISSGIIYMIALNISVTPIFLPFLYLILFSLYILFLILMREITREDWVEIQQIIPSWIPLRH